MARSPTVEVLVVCGAVFLVQFLVDLLLGRAVMFGLVALAMPLEANPWTVVTSVYAHSGPSHLVGNLVAFAVLGLILERYTTPTRFHLFVLGTGAAAGLFQVLASGALGRSTAVLGLSGAVFALLGYLLTGNRLADGLLSNLGLSSEAQLVLFVVLAGVVTWLTASPGVALGGHFFGFLLGLLGGRANLLAPSGRRSAATR